MRVCDFLVRRWEFMKTTITSEDIMLMLQQREQARANRDFTEADRIRAELLNRGIHINDKVRTWTSSDGRTGMRPSARGGIVPPTDPFPPPSLPQPRLPSSLPQPRPPSSLPQPRPPPPRPPSSQIMHERNPSMSMPRTIRLTIPMTMCGIILETVDFFPL